LFHQNAKGLKNARCTFSRMIAIVLHPQLRRNIIAYYDDIIIKSVQRSDHIGNLAETFANLNAIILKLNPDKCVLAFTRERSWVACFRQRVQKQIPTKSRP
jgi:hypothetical protein